MDGISISKYETSTNTIKLDFEKIQNELTNDIYLKIDKSKVNMNIVRATEPNHS